MVYGQDFYFCNHHASELADLLVTLPAVDPSLDLDVAPEPVLSSSSW